MTMTSVTIWFRGTVLAGAPSNNFLFFNGFNNGFEICTFMGSVTERIFRTPSTGTPGIGAGFYFHNKRAFAINNNFIHIIEQFVS